MGWTTQYKIGFRYTKDLEGELRLVPKVDGIYDENHAYITLMDESIVGGVGDTTSYYTVTVNVTAYNPVTAINGIHIYKVQVYEGGTWQDVDPFLDFDLAPLGEHGHLGSNVSIDSSAFDFLETTTETAQEVLTDVDTKLNALTDTQVSSDAVTDKATVNAALGDIDDRVIVLEGTVADTPTTVEGKAVSRGYMISCDEVTDNLYLCNWLDWKFYKTGDAEPQTYHRIPLKGEYFVTLDWNLIENDVTVDPTKDISIKFRVGAQGTAADSIHWSAFITAEVAVAPLKQVITADIDLGYLFQQLGQAISGPSQTLIICFGGFPTPDDDPPTISSEYCRMTAIEILAYEYNQALLQSCMAPTEEVTIKLYNTTTSTVIGQLVIPIGATSLDPITINAIVNPGDRIVAYTTGDIQDVWIILRRTRYVGI